MSSKSTENASSKKPLAERKVHKLTINSICKAFCDKLNENAFIAVSPNQISIMEPTQSKSLCESKVSTTYNKNREPTTHVHTTTSTDSNERKMSSPRTSQNLKYKIIGQPRGSTLMRDRQKEQDETEATVGYDENEKENVRSLVDYPSSSKQQPGLVSKMPVRHTKAKVQSAKSLIAPRNSLAAMKSQQIIIGNGKVSPIRPNPLTDPNTLIFGKIIMAKRSEKELCSSPKKFVNDDMSQDILATAKVEQHKFVLPKNFLTKYNHHGNMRIAVVSWMLSVQHILCMKSSEFYLAVHLLDQVFAKIHVPRNMNQLVAVTCMWIAEKFSGTGMFESPLLLRICADVYHQKQLISMEMKILKLLDYHIPTIEPSVFIGFYLNALKIKPEAILYTSIYFTLDSIAHLKEFSTNPPSLVATAALFVAFKLFHRNNYQAVKVKLLENLSHEDKERCKTIITACISMIDYMKNKMIKSDILLKYTHCSWITQGLTRQFI